MRRLLTWRTVLVLAGIAGILAFPFGPLLPLSPVHPGYSVRSFGRADILYPAGTELPTQIGDIDRFVRRAERYENLQGRKRITVVLCRGWGDFFRFLPVRSLRAAAGVTLPKGRVIYLTPRISETKLDPGEVLAHEVAHAVLHQNQSILNAIRAGRQEWFTEGLAVSAGAQKGFGTAGEFLARSMHQELGPVIDPEERSAAPQPFDMRFAYQAWRYFLEYLVETRGQQRFDHFTETFAADPAKCRELFVAVYGVGLPQAIQEFETAIRSGRWIPSEDFLVRQFGV